MSKILVVDSDSQTRNLCKLILEEMGHEVTAVNKSQQALTSCETNNFDLLIIDLDTDRPSRSKLFAGIQEQGFTGRAIAICGSGTEAKKIASLKENGFSDVLVKVFDNQTLEKAVNEALA
ncbi:MAG: hypothetical protein CMI53_03605 [Parcubacteria group bacterium]|nr:hypothetical protein [Parcubacteria group bacterium]|tara:strand:- start:2937 stop:3296 length:360 start_codon:yes stop_codon:yes gene_type:complete